MERAVHTMGNPIRTISRNQKKKKKRKKVKLRRTAKKKGFYFRFMSTSAEMRAKRN